MLAWISTFIAGWMIFLRFVTNDGLSWMLFAFFLIVAIMASAMTMERKRA
jgi:hypothetical protein